MSSTWQVWAKRCASVVQKYPLNLFPWSAILPRIVRMLLMACFFSKTFYKHYYFSTGCEAAIASEHSLESTTHT